MIVGLALTWFAILAGGWLGWQLLRQNGRLLLRLEELEKRLDELEFGGDENKPEGLPVGSEAPAFELPDLTGEHKSLAQYAGQPLLLVFFNPACGFCREMMPKLAGMRRSEARGQKSKVGLLIVTAGDAEKNRPLFDEHQLDCPVLLQEGTEVADAYQANGTPSGYLVSVGGKIASELAMGGEALMELLTDESKIENRKSKIDESLVTSAAMVEEDGRANRFSNRSLAKSKLKRDGLKAGTVAPEFSLPRLDGRGELALRDLRGRRILLVFSSPSCGPCVELAPKLEEFHREHPELELVMVSKGEPKENRAEVKKYGLSFPVLLQQQWEIARKYAIFATPVAYLIDAAGTLVKDVAVGTDGILALLAETGHKPEENVLTIN